MLNQDQVQRQLQDEIELLMVDEFQDTSPIQLAIFLKLADFASEKVWVGDPKQAIYGFRGTDPELMNAFVNQLPSDQIQDLSTTYRSRQPLATLVNTLFSDRFTQYQTPEQVQVSAHRTSDEGLQRPLHIWAIQNDKEKAPNKDFQMKAIARNIQDKLKSNIPVQDKESGENRPIEPGDVAVLCRQNRDCSTFAKELQQLGYQVAYAGPGLMKTAEAVLLSACLKKVIEPADTLATAEILLLTDPDPDPGRMIDERLAFLYEQHDPDDVNDEEWGKENAVVQTVMALRDQLQEVSVREALQMLIEATNLDRHINKWGNARQRQANLDQLLFFARQYTESCRKFEKAATLSGFLVHMQQRAADQTDETGSFEGGGAITVATYHKAKGLEWPMVVLFDLQKKIEPRVFGVKVQEGDFDISHPLQGRSLRYWVWPYGNKGNVPHLQQIEQYQQWEEEAKQKELEENKRVLYVGMTRARDYLILAGGKGKAMNWFNEVTGRKFADAFLKQAANDDQTATTFGANGREVPLVVDTKKFPEFDQQQDAAAGEETVAMFPEPAGRQPYDPLRFSPSTDPAFVPEATSEVIAQVHERIAIHEAIEDEELGELLHNILCAYPEQFNETDEQQTMRYMMYLHGCHLKLDEADLWQKIEQFYKTVQDKYQPQHIQKEVPLQMGKNGQYISGFADMVLHCEDGLRLIDHKSFQGGREQALEKAKTYAGQLSTYAEMITAATGQEVVETLIYFPVGGWVVRVD